MLSAVAAVLSLHAAPRAVLSLHATPRAVLSVHAAPRAQFRRSAGRMAVSDLDDATRVRNEAEHNEECEASEARFFHSRASATTSPPVEFDCYSFPGPSYLGADALPPDKFGADELARVTIKPLISAAECASMIADAEAHASWHTAGRSAHYASRAGASVSILDLPDALALVNSKLLPALLPALGDAFPTGMLNADIRLQEARLVKYNATAGQTELGMHRDGPVVTATVALNAPQEYEGGGTLIEALAAAAFRVERGCAVLHPGSVRHGGAELTSGVRYILVCFLFDATVVDHDRRCLLRANAALSKALSANRGSEFSVALLREAVAEFDRSLLCGNAEKAESAHVGRGHALLELGETAAAVAALEAAVERAPRNAFGLSTLAAARKALGDVDGACAAGRAACDADARSAVARNNLGLLLLDGKGRPDEAMAVFAEGLEIDPDDPELLVNCGVAAADLGAIPTAIKLFAAALEASPSHERARQNLAACVAMGG